MGNLAAGLSMKACCPVPRSRVETSPCILIGFIGLLGSKRNRCCRSIPGMLGGGICGLDHELDLWKPGCWATVERQAGCCESGGGPQRGPGTPVSATRMTPGPKGGEWPRADFLSSSSSTSVDQSERWVESRLSRRRSDRISPSSSGLDSPP